MDLPYGSDFSYSFVTNVGLITSSSLLGPDIMLAEWTHHISYKPGLIAVCIASHHATYDNIIATGEFGVNIASNDQNVLTSVSGGSSGKNVDKIKVLEELGFKFFPAKQVKILMVEGAVLNAECRLLKKVDIGDHPMFIGEVVEATVHSEKTPLVYYKGKYWHFGENIHKPPPSELDRIKQIVEKYRRK